MEWLLLGLCISVCANIVGIAEVVSARQLPPGSILYIRSSIRSVPDQPFLPNLTLSLSIQPPIDLHILTYPSSELLLLLRDKGPESELRSGVKATQLCDDSGKWSIQPPGNATTWQVLNNTYRVLSLNSTDGIYYTLLANCGGNSSEVQVNGTLTALNPYGYLPGEAIPLLNFYKLLAGLYSLLLFIWTATVCLHRDSTTPLQTWVISSVLVTSLLEYTLTFALCDYINLFGYQPLLLVLPAAITKGIKDTFIRVLMLTIAKGVGVVRHSIGKATAFAIAILAISYLTAHLMYEKVLYRNLHHHASSEGKYFTPVFLSICSTVFFYWTYISLLAVRKELKAVKQGFKLGKMKEVAGVLVVTGIWAVAWVGFQNYFILTRSQDEYWHFHWLFEGMWQLVFLFVICALTWLWWPDEQWSAREDSEELRQEEDGVLEAEVELTSRSDMPFGYLKGTESPQD